jgi:hypothetical protein
VRDGQTSPQRPWLVVSRSTCPPLSPPHANSFVTGTAVINTHTPAPPWVGSRSPDGWDQIPRWAGGWGLHQPPWSFGFDSQTRGTRENRAPPCVKVPGSSRVPSPPRSLVRDGQTSPHRPRLVVPPSTCPPMFPPPPTKDGKPLVGMRTGTRHEDGRLTLFRRSKPRHEGRGGL